MSESTDEKIQRLLKIVYDHYDKEDISVRERQLLLWKKLKLFWEGYQRVWYSEVAHDWRIWNDNGTNSDSDQAYYDDEVNVFRAYLESIIAALSIVVPPVTCYPEDADNVLDLLTAKAGDKIGEMIFKHNECQLLWLHTLFIYCTEGMLAFYTYPDEDEAYGMYDDNKYEDVEENHQMTTCPTCGYVIEDEVINKDANDILKSDIKDKFDPNNSDIELEDYANSEMELCPSCQSTVFPELTEEKLTISRLVGTTKKPKSRVCMEVYGGLYVKVPNYARKQKECPFLYYMYESNYASVVEQYEHLHGNKDLIQRIKSDQGPQDPYEEWARLNPQYRGEYPEHVITIKNCWFRRSAFNCLLDLDDVKFLKKQFPSGCKAVFANDLFAHACNESMDDRWTLSYNPLADFIHFDPVGLLLTSIQSITNDIISLTKQTIEQGIGQAFADPGVLDFDAYRQMEAIPGQIYEAKPKTGQRIADSFFEFKTAALSPEVMPFAQNIQTLAQLVSGALPSLFGGAIEGSETASQYSMSRNQALQRQQNVWKMLISCWKNVFGKAIPLYMKLMKSDEKYVTKNDEGNFINVFIRRAEIEGRIGSVELEGNENIPLTWGQKKDTIMQLLLAGNPQILQIIGSPENIPIIRHSIGLTDFYVPGEDQREKQYDEIRLLLDSEPIESMNPMMPVLPSIEPDETYDDHALHFEICKKWIVSEAGRQAKVNNESGYKNVMYHGIMHKFIMDQAMMMQGLPDSGQGAVPDEKVNKEQGKEAPITGEADVQTV